MVFAFFQWRSAGLAYRTAPLALVRSLATAPNRPVYAHSVVPGGVFSRAELEQAASREVVVSAHYRDLMGRRLWAIIH